MVSKVQKKITFKHNIPTPQRQTGHGLTDWPSEALFVSVDYSPHTSELCSQEPIHPSWK